MKHGVHGFDYDRLRREYSASRRTDPRIASVVHEALGDSTSVINVGAGTGSYEPRGRRVVAVEPSATMRAQRSTEDAPAIAAQAEALPFRSDSFEAAMAMLTVHHWSDLRAGLLELRRVASGPVVILTFDSSASTEFWLADYLPEMTEVETRRYGPVDRLVETLGDRTEVRPIDVPRDCLDRFQVALYARPELFLEDDVRKAQSAWAHLPGGAEARFVAELARDLASGEWVRRYGSLRERATIRCQLRLVLHPGSS